jgi:hypothetical protein
MDIKQMRKEITELIDSIKEHSDELTNSAHIPTLEFELMLAKVEKLYKQLAIFNHYYSALEQGDDKKKVETEAVQAKEYIVTAKHSWPDLKNLIGINQKFQIVSELFKGDNNEFNEAVIKINSLYNKEEALIYVQGLKAAFSWKDDSSVADGFIKIVTQRYQ